MSTEPVSLHTDANLQGCVAQRGRESMSIEPVSLQSRSSISHRPKGGGNQSSCHKSGGNIFSCSQSGGTCLIIYESLELHLFCWMDLTFYVLCLWIDLPFPEGASFAVLSVLLSMFSR